MENDRNEKSTEEQANELTDSELDMVAGGKGRICPFLYIEWGQREAAE